MSPSRLPEQVLIDNLRNTDGRGTFEAHITILADNLEQRQFFREICDTLGVKCVLIELPQGATRSQPMTSSYHRGELSAVLAEVVRLAERVRAHGFDVSRVKLEAVITNEGIPESDADAARFPAGNYFEFHAKVVLPASADLAPLQAICKPHNAHLSSNALKRDDQQRCERFITLRLYRVGRVRAEGAFEHLLADLEAAGHVPTNRLREYTLFDSNSTLDAGWLESPARASHLP